MVGQGAVEGNNLMAASLGMVVVVQAAAGKVVVVEAGMEVVAMVAAESLEYKASTSLQLVLAPCFHQASLNPSHELVPQ